MLLQKSLVYFMWNLKNLNKDMDIIQWIIKNWGILPLGAIVTYFVRDRYFIKKDLASKEIDTGSAYLNNVDQGLNIYKRMFEDFESKLELKDIQINLMEKEIDVLRQRINMLEKNQNSK